MSVFADNSVGMLDWVLILAPYRKDASYMASLLLEHGIRAQAVTAIELADRIAEFPGVLVVTHEALNPVAIKIITQFLQDQPNWSEIESGTGTWICAFAQGGPCGYIPLA